jgi:aldose 1-epimerase
LSDARFFGSFNSVRTGIEKTSFGFLRDGREIHLYTLTNVHGLRCSIATYGGTVTQLHVPDRSGQLKNIVLGYDRLEDYEAGTAYLGAIIGRVANRIGRARFSLDGKTYLLAANDRRNHLHGGIKGFDKRVWTASEDQNSLKLHYTSPDGEEGYPGNLQVTVTYALTDANELTLDYEANTDQSTPVNLTSHPYWTLAGAGNILGHELMIAADEYTPCNEEHIPTGEIKKVKGTPFDFTSPIMVGRRFNQLIGQPPAYNTNFILRRETAGLAFAAKLFDRRSGRVLELWTDQSGLQFYTGTFLSEAHQPYAGLCLETQQFPDAVNHGNFPSPILRPGETYRQTMVCRFSSA